MTQLLDYFAAEEPIVEQLRLNVPLANGDILTFSDSSKIEENQKNKAIALHVVHGGDALGRASSDGRSQVVDQIWLIIVAVREPSDQTSGAKLRDIAGPVICQVLRALQGFVPTEFHGPLVRYQTLEPVYQSGFAFFPLAFTTKITI